MGVYQAAVNAKAGVNATNTPLFHLRTNASDRLYVKAFAWTIATAPTTATQCAITRTTALGTSTTTVAGQPADSAEVASSATLDSAWSVNPTWSTTGPHLFTWTMPVTAGSTFVWYAPDERSRIVIPISLGLMFSALNASGATVGAHSLWVCWEE